MMRFRVMVATFSIALALVVPATASAKDCGLLGWVIGCDESDSVEAEQEHERLIVESEQDWALKEMQILQAGQAEDYAFQQRIAAEQGALVLRMQESDTQAALRIAGDSNAAALEVARSSNAAALSMVRDTMMVVAEGKQADNTLLIFLSGVSITTALTAIAIVSVILYKQGAQRAVSKRPRLNSRAIGMLKSEGCAVVPYGSGVIVTHPRYGRSVTLSAEDLDRIAL